MEEFILNKNRNGIEWFSIPQFDKTNLVKAVFTTKIGGDSTGKYESLNLGERTEDHGENVDKNYEKVYEALSIKRTVSLHQIHSDVIKEVKTKDLKSHKGRLMIDSGDAMITNDVGIAVLTYHADCIPVYILDTKNRAIGLVHSGWKGTAQGIAVKTIDKMQIVYNSHVSHLLAAIGPGIDFCCFETGEEVYDVFNNNFPYAKNYCTKLSQRKYIIDLKGIIKRQLESKGLENISVSSACTVCQKELFFSHRRDKGNTGRMAAILQLL